jgi:hypothetical protein
MLNAFYDAVKSVRGDNEVVTAGTAPYGDPPGGNRTRPLSFWRGVLCLKSRKKLNAAACPVKAEFDVLAHHPINTSGGPRLSALNPDDASTPDLKYLRKILRAAERHKTVATPGHHPLWATELWWDSDPPDTKQGVPIQKHARYLEEALYLLWKQGARTVINLQLQDAPFAVEQPFAYTATGIFFADGSPKPAYTAFRFPFVTERRGKKTLQAWGKSPADGRLTIERKRKGGWQRVKRMGVRDGQVFQANLRLRGQPRLRATVGDDTSLAWHQR